MYWHVTMASGATYSYESRKLSPGAVLRQLREDFVAIVYNSVISKEVAINTALIESVREF